VPSVIWCGWWGSRKGIRPVKKLSDGVLARLSLRGEVQICIWPSWCHCHSLSLASVKSRLVLVPPHPGNPGLSPDGCKMDVCVCVHMYYCKANGLCYHYSICLAVIPIHSDRMAKYIIFFTSFFHTNTHNTHNRFTVLLEYVRDHPSEQVPER